MVLVVIWRFRGRLRFVMVRIILGLDMVDIFISFEICYR